MNNIPPGSDHGLTVLRFLADNITLQLENVRGVLTDAMKMHRTAAEWAHVFRAVRGYGAVYAELTKVADDAINELKIKTIPEAFEREGVTTFTLADGSRVSVSSTVRASVKVGKKSEAYEWLKANNLADLITETVNAGTLSAAIKKMMEDGTEPPDDVFNVHVQSMASLTLKK